VSQKENMAIGSAVVNNSLEIFFILGYYDPSSTGLIQTACSATQVETTY